MSKKCKLQGEWVLSMFYDRKHAFEDDRKQKIFVWKARKTFFI